MATPYPQPAAPQQQPPAYAQQPYTQQQPYQQPYPQGYYAPPPLPPRPWSHVAISGFVASLIGLGLIGLPVSIAGVVITQRKPYLRGSGLAIIGIFLGLFWTFININFLIAFLDSASV